MSRHLHNRPIALLALLAGCAVVAWGAGILAAPSAQAQFVCDIVGGGGAGATATGGNDSMACGIQANAGANATAIGAQANSAGANSVAIGAGAIAADTATVLDANTAIGAGAQAMAANTIALGANARALHDNSIVIAVGNLFGLPSTRANQVLLGSFTNTYTLSGVASSASRAVQGTVNGVVTTDAAGNLASDGGALQSQVNSNTTSIASVQAQANSNTANIASIQANGTTFLATNMTGAAATATGANSFAAGASSVASGNNALAIGTGAQATGLESIAIGSGALATGSVAVGAASSAANGGAAFGDNAVATGTNATAVGNGAQATFSSSAAFGSGAVATRANQQVLGTTSNTYTTPGITSAASRAAQSGPTQIVTSDAGGNLATATPADLGLASMGDINAINSQLGTINARLDDLSSRSNRAYSGVAMAMALTGGYLPEHKKFAIAVNYGTFERQNAAALSSYFRLNETVVLSGGLSYGFEQRQFGGRAGMLFAR